MAIRVVNKHFHKPTPNDFYIGRGRACGNRYSHMEGTKAEFKVATREEAVAACKKDFIQRLEAGDKELIRDFNRIYLLAKIGDVNLVCYCAPKLCHGDVIKKMVEEKLNNL